MKRKPVAKGVALSVATAMVVFGIELLRAGDSIQATIAILMGATIFVVYTIIDDADQRKKVDELVDVIGEDTLKELSDRAADELRRLFEEMNQRDTTESKDGDENA